MLNSLYYLQTGWCSRFLLTHIITFLKKRKGLGLFLPFFSQKVCYMLSLFSESLATQITWTSCIFLFLVFYLKNLFLVYIPKMQAAPEHRDLAHKISHELRCAGPESPHTTEGLNDEWFTSVLTIAYSLSAEEWNLASGKKQKRQLHFYLLFQYFKIFLSFLLEIRCFKNRLKNKFKKRAC